MSPISARTLVDAGESCGVFVGATTSVFGSESMSFWDLAREARNSIAANQNREYIAAGISAFQEVVGNGTDVATAAEFGATVFANEIMVTNLGSLSFDRQFGPVTLKALFGPAVLTGFENHQTIGVATEMKRYVYCTQVIRHWRDYSSKRRASSRKRANARIQSSCRLRHA